MGRNSPIMPRAILVKVLIQFCAQSRQAIGRRSQIANRAAVIRFLCNVAYAVLLNQPARKSSRDPVDTTSRRQDIARGPQEVAMLADAILVVHFAIVLFITAGLPVIYLGAAAGWTWVREWRWRALHFAAILVVATESILGLACPLTVWEDALRGHRAREEFIEHWIGRILFFNLPAWVFLVAYICFALLIAITWVIVPPVNFSRRQRYSR